MPKTRQPPDFWKNIVHRIMPRLRELADPDTGLWEGSLTALLEELKIGSRPSHVAVMQRLRLVTLHERAIRGTVAERMGREQSTIWRIKLTTTTNPSHGQVAAAYQAWLKDREEKQQRRQQRRQEERLAGSYPEQTTGSPVHEARPDDNHGRDSDHMNTFTHRHGMKHGRHRHQADGIVWERTVHFHLEEMDHEHAGRKGRHYHVPGDPAHPGVPDPATHWVEIRHHTHQAKAGERDSGVVTREVTEELAGGRAAMLERAHQVPAERPGETPSEGRHRRLMGLVVRLEARVAELELATSESEIRREALRAELAEERAKRKELEALLESATDPTEQEAEEFLKERGQ